MTETKPHFTLDQAGNVVCLEGKFVVWVQHSESMKFFAVVVTDKIRSLPV